LSNSKPNSKISPRGLPILGHALSYIKSPTSYQLKLLENYGEISSISLFGKKVYFPVSPIDVKEVLVNQANKVSKGVALQNAKLVVGNNILTSEKDDHIQKRKVLSQAFSLPAIAEYETYLKGYLQTFIEDLEVIDKEVSLVDFYDQIGIEIISTILFGKSNKKINQLVTENLHIGMTIVSYLTIPIYKYLLPLPFPKHLRFRKTQKLLEKEVSKLISERSSHFSKDIVDILIKSGCSEKEIYEQVLVIFMAGHETTSTFMIWLTYSLTHYPYDKERFQKETVTALSKQATLKDLDNYIYIKAVIYETLRLYPSVWNIGREVLEDITLSNHTIKKGSLISLSPFVSHRNPRYFKDPHQFNPQRWINEDDTFHEKDKYVFFPFSRGTRNCIGERMALAEAFQIIIHFYSQLSFTINEKKEINFKPLITLRPSQDILFTIKRRDNNE
jgi:cytochrome P450